MSSNIGIIRAAARWSLAPHSNTQPEQFRVSTFFRSYGAILIIMTASLLYKLALEMLAVGGGAGRGEERAAISEVERWRYLIVGGGVAPIAEELTFRLPLFISRRNFAIASLSLLVLLGFLSRNAVAGDSINTSVLLVALIAGAIAVGMIALFYKARTDYMTAVGRRLRENFPVVLYTSCFIFALGHSGISTSIATNLLSLLHVIPFFVMGIFLSFLRVRFGLIASISCHIAANSTVLSLILLQ